MVYSTSLDALASRIPAACLDDLLKSRKTPLETCLDELSPEYLFEEKELLSLAERAVDSLPPRRKAAVLMHLQGLSLEEMALYLGESTNAVRHLLYRGLDEVRGKISELSGSFPARRRRKAAAPRLEWNRT
jgi:DNA-directed RNA polymerase specialized sigma24 family protein